MTSRWRGKPGLWSIETIYCSYPYWRIKGDEGGKQLVIFHVYKRGGFYLSMRTPLFSTRNGWRFWRQPKLRCVRFRVWLTGVGRGFKLGLG